jgi:hypothetical protein
MSTARNSKPANQGDSTRRLRFDDFASIIAQRLSNPRSGALADELTEGHSGRRFVLVAGAAFVVFWGILFWAFHNWKSGYRQRAAYGASQVLPVVDSLSAIVPPDVDVNAWRDAVKETRAMLATVVGSNLLNVDDMDNLRSELMRHAEQARANPASARDELASIWNELADRAGFLFQDSRSPKNDRHPRPKILPPPTRPAVAPPALQLPQGRR